MEAGARRKERGNPAQIEEGGELKARRGSQGKQGGKEEARKGGGTDLPMKVIGRSVYGGGRRGRRGKGGVNQRGGGGM